MEAGDFYWIDNLNMWEMLGQIWKEGFALGLEGKGDQDTDATILLRDDYGHGELLEETKKIATCTPDLQSFLVEEPLPLSGSLPQNAKGKFNRLRVSLT